MKYVIFVLFFLKSTFAVKLGVVSYWDTDFPAQFNRIPSGSLAILNVDYSDLIRSSPTEELAAHQRIASGLLARGVQLVGYVPTGYFRHGADIDGTSQTWNHIQTQTAAYFRHFPALTGIFFDETAPEDELPCTAYQAEFQRLRSIAKTYKSSAKLVFNTGYPEDCAITAVQAGETLVVFESAINEFRGQERDVQRATQMVKAKGAQSWILVATTKTATDMRYVVQKAKLWGADYVYVTNVGTDWRNGENTWGAPPPYFAEQVSAVLN